MGKLSALTEMEERLRRGLRTREGIARANVLLLDLADRLGAPSGPGNGGTVFTYRLHLVGTAPRRVTNRSNRGALGL